MLHVYDPFLMFNVIINVFHGNRLIKNLLYTGNSLIIEQTHIQLIQTDTHLYRCACSKFIIYNRRAYVLANVDDDDDMAPRTLFSVRYRRRRRIVTRT